VQTTSATDQPSPRAMIRGVVCPGNPSFCRCASARQSSAAIFAKTRFASETYNSLTRRTVMAALYLGSYDIVDPGEFQKYPPLVLALLPRYGGEVLASDMGGVLVEGTLRTMNAVIRFPSKDAALALYNDPDYQEAKRIRQASTRNISMVLVEEFRG
jgi:uncharacterized protein (DUF1330 family)